MNSAPPSTRAEKIIIGLSGGVDSSVAAKLLLDQGHDVEGLFMKNWEEDDHSGYCSAEEDMADARAVAEQLGIRFHTVNFAHEYWEQVFSHFLQEYRVGRTPNPDVLCNREIKFRAFLDHAVELGAEAIATGHYARIQASAGRYHLLKGGDHNKDQSYFLHLLNQKQLSSTRFPLGELEKNEVRKIAEQAGLSNAKKRDSTGICFIGERDFHQFLSQYLPAQPGPIQTPEGETIGQHQGLMYHTLGQRKGLGIGGLPHFSEAPWYVIKKDIENNILIAGQQKDHPLLMCQQIECEPIHWITAPPTVLPFHCQAQHRYRQADQTCTITRSDASGATITFLKPQRAVTPGQSIVFYQEEQCLGGGVIK
ncbi:MAG: tRNA 2-thiouridine(34) synthase MnmA [Gammaproteobacteria bacterium]|jgi:tRNA-uridine 2-sulfurtransferase|nr:tRNA 2-thiouridine(34) synthase MnmA [Gammaproteobacteria bacterium]